MKIFDGMQSFFESLGEYVKNFSNLFLIFLGAFLIVSVIIIVITSFAYECKLTKTIDKINRFLERNPRINDDNLVAFNNMMKARGVPKILRRQWQQFMLYREHPASYYMSFKHCVENPLRNSTYRQQMTVYKIISLVLIALSLVVSTFMATQSFNANVVLKDIVVIPITILVLYWLISMVLDLIHSAVSGDLFQNYQYFEINMDKAMLTLPEFVDYEVLFSQDEIRRGIPVLFAYLQKRAIQEQQELEKARLKSVDHEKFDFDKAGLDGSLVLDRAMRETENYTTQRKKYMQETERVNNEIAVLENNYKEQMKEFQRQVQTSKETVENLKEQLEQATSTIEINYIKKQMRDEINRQQLSEKEFDILTDKHNQEVKALNQEIKHYDEETKKAKEAMEVAMLSEFNTYSVKVYDNLEKIVDEKMQDRVDDYKGQIKDLEIELEEKNEELENVYTRYQEVLAQVPVEEELEMMEEVTELPLKKGKKKKKSSQDETPVDDGMVQPEQVDQYDYDQQYYSDGQDEYYEQNYEDGQGYESQDDNRYNEDYGNYQDNIQEGDLEYQQQDELLNDEYVPEEGQEDYIPLDSDYTEESNDYIPLDDNYTEETNEYIPLDDGFDDSASEYIPLDNEYASNNDYQYENDYNETNYDNQEFESGEYIPLNEEYVQDENNNENQYYVPLDEEMASNAQSDNNELVDETAVEETNEKFDDSDFDIDFGKTSKTDFDNLDFDIDFGFDSKDDKVEKPIEKVETPDEVDEGELDLNKILGLYENIPSKEESKDLQQEQPAEQVKRKAGRPRKVVDETEEKPKRKPGRPKKIKTDEESLEKPKRKAGRPRKVVDETEVKPKRKPGRPRKTVDETEVKPKRKVGRPRKVVGATEEQPKRKPGRPRKVKNEVNLEQPKRRGRPKKVQASKDVVVDAEGVLGKPKRKAGRPRKSSK